MSIIILQKSPQEIKRFLADISGMDRQDDIQRHIQKVYAEECFRIADHYSTDEKLLYSFSSVENMTPASLIQSSDCRKIVINNTHEITLRLYQFRSCDKKHYEDILIEPFYPGSKATIYDIFLILAKYSFRESCSGKLLSYRIRYDMPGPNAFPITVKQMVQCLFCGRVYDYTAYLQIHIPGDSDLKKKILDKTLFFQDVLAAGKNSNLSRPASIVTILRD